MKRGLENGLFFGSAMVDMYDNCNGISSGRHAFDGLPKRNVVSWTAVVAICTQNGFL